MKILSKETWTIYGNKNPEILIAGHSHVFPMYMAVNRRQNQHNLFGVASQADFSKSVDRDQDYWQFVAKNSKQKTVVILWNGNQHNIHFLVDTDQPFKVFGYLPGPEIYPVVSISRIKKLFEPTFLELRETLNKFKKQTKIVLAQTPPPKSKVFLDSKLHLDPFFLNLAKQLDIPKSKLQASTDELRLAMWGITQDMTRDLACEFDLEYFDLPSHTVSSNGLLAEEYWTDDLSHANEDFGSRWLDEFAQSRGIKN